MNIADILGIDPIVTLTETNPDHMAARAAAAVHLARQREEQNKTKK